MKENKTEDYTIKVQTVSSNSWGMSFEIEIKNGDERTYHSVNLDRSYYETLTRKRISPEQFIERSFEFLLEREPPSAILRSFNVQEINHYFPEYEETIMEKK